MIIGIAGLRAITREIDLPFVPDDEIDSAVRFQSEEVIPFPPDKTILSAQVLADFTAPDGTAMRRVLVAAAHRDLVEGVVSAVEAAGLQVEGVDLVSSALVRALVDPATMSDSPEAIVSVGAGLTVVVVHQHGRPRFVRTVGIGGTRPGRRGIRPRPAVGRRGSIEAAAGRARATGTGSGTCCTCKHG